MATVPDRPSDIAVVLAAIPRGDARADGWVFADDVSMKLGLLGFDCSSQQVAAWLTRIALDLQPCVERRSAPWVGGPWQYRITAHGKTLVWNRLAIRLETPWLPTMRGAAS